MSCIIYPAFVNIQSFVFDILHMIHVKMNGVPPPHISVYLKMINCLGEMYKAPQM